MVVNKDYLALHLKGANKASEVTFCQEGLLARVFVKGVTGVDVCIGVGKLVTRSENNTRRYSLNPRDVASLRYMKSCGVPVLIVYDGDRFELFKEENLETDILSLGFYGLKEGKCLTLTQSNVKRLTCQ